jgi:hypothetical protein
MANPTFNISLNYPEVTSATKRIEKSQSNILLKIVQEITVKGKLLELNNLSGYSEIWAQIDAIEDNKEAKNCTLNFAGLLSYSGVKITDISFENTSNQDVQSKDFSISFEVYEAVNSSLLTSYGVNLSDLKDISDIKISQAREENLEGKTLTTSIGITFGENANNYSLSRAQGIANAILNATNVLSVSSSRTTASNVYDETSGTYSFIETKNEYRGSSGGFSVLRSTNYNIQNNGSIVASENGQIKINKNNDFTIKELYDKALSESGGAKVRCQTFVSTYYSLTYGSLPSGYRSTFEETSRQITVDEAAGTSQYNVSITNEPEYIEGVRVEIVDTTEDLKREKAKRKIIRGTITGIRLPPDKEINPNSNRKLAAAKNYFDSNYKQLFTQAKDFASIDPKIGDYKTYITNGDITYNISEGSINFSITYEDRPEYDVSNSNMILGKAEITNQSPVHLGNQFLIIGGQQPGEELIQESNQAKPVEINFRVEALFKKATDIKTYISTFKGLIQSNYQDGILKSLNISSNLIGRTFQGTASWLKFGGYRQRNDTAIKVTNPTEIRL